MDFSIRTLITIQNSTMASVVCAPEPITFTHENGVIDASITIDTGRKLINIRTDDGVSLTPNGTELIVTCGNGKYLIDCRSSGGALATYKHMFDIVSQMYQKRDRAQSKLDAKEKKSHS